MTEEKNEEVVVVEQPQQTEGVESVEDLLFPKEEEVDPEKSIDERHTIAGGEDSSSEDSQPAEEQTIEEITSGEETTQDKLKFIQSSYQKHLELLKQNSPALFQQIQAQVKAERGQDVDTNQISDDLVDDPYSQQIQKGFDNLQRQQHAQINADKYMQEYSQASNSLDGFVSENNVSQKDLNMAFNKASAMGFDMETASKNFQIGVPTKAVNYIMETLQNKLMQDYYMGKQEKIEQDTIKKTDAVNSVAQPNSGATPEPQKLTKNEKLLKAMNEVRSGEKATIKELFNT